jgi:hypothetical protein
MVGYLHLYRCCWAGRAQAHNNYIHASTHTTAGSERRFAELGSAAAPSGSRCGYYYRCNRALRSELQPGVADYGGSSSSTHASHSLAWYSVFPCRNHPGRALVGELPCVRSIGRWLFFRSSSWRLRRAFWGDPLKPALAAASFNVVRGHRMARRNFASHALSHPYYHPPPPRSASGLVESSRGTS